MVVPNLDSVKKGASSDVPSVLHRGMVFSDEKFAEFDIAGDLQMPPAFFYDENGRKNVMDGQEYGIYLADAEVFAEQYSVRAVRRGGGTTLSEQAIGFEKEKVAMPEVAVLIDVYALEINAGSIRRPLLDKGLGNQRGFGNEYLATAEIPKECIAINRLMVGPDLLFPAKEIKAQSKTQARGQVLQELAKRREALELFAFDVDSLPKEKRSPLNGRAIVEAGKVLYGEGGALLKADKDKNDADRLAESIYKSDGFDFKRICKAKEAVFERASERRQEQ